MKYKRGNTYYFVNDYAVVFYNNNDHGFFIVDSDKVSLIEKYTWTCDKTRFEPVTTINGKKTRLCRFLMNTPVGMQCDHINGIVADNRMCNLRNCTAQENSYNRKKFALEVKQVGEKYKIVNSPKSAYSKVLFDSYEEAEQVKNNLIENIQGEYSYECSQKLAEEFETNEFKNYTIYGGVLEEINNLPEKNIWRRMLRNILRNTANGIISDGQMLLEFEKLKSNYIEDRKESA